MYKHRVKEEREGERERERTQLCNHWAYTYVMIANTYMSKAMTQPN